MGIGWPEHQPAAASACNSATTYAIRVENPEHVCGGAAVLELDGTTLAVDGSIPRVHDGGHHAVRIMLG